MMENNHTQSTGAPQGAYHPALSASQRVKPAPPREYTAAERALLPVALLVAFLFDRLLVATFWNSSIHLPFYSAIFWLSFLAIYYTFYWKRLKSRPVLWLVGALTALLCVWSFLFDYRSEYGSLSLLVIPAVIMAHTQFLAGDYRLKEVGKIAQAWLLGWLVKPFIAIPHFAGAAGSVFSGKRQSQLKKVTIGAGVAVLLLLVIVPLLGSADRVFDYFLRQLLSGLRLSSLLVHLFVVAFALLLIYSFLWSIGFAGRAGEVETVKRERLQVDAVISCIVLGSIAVVYLLFCTVQFTYLFARAGLPGNLTYSEYAREGFSQMVAVCTINLLIFGVFLQYGKPHRATTVLLAVLLALTGVILVSSFVRLYMYIAVYGLTWLRLLSGWFILYLAAVLLLCGARMIRPAIPLIAVSAFLLLGWYVTLGFASPDAMIVRHNLQISPDHSAWLEKNQSYVARLSDNAALALLDSDVDSEQLYILIDDTPRFGAGHSLSSRILQDRIRR